MNMLNSCLHLNGDVVECGVASGANTFPLADMVKTWNKKNGTRKRVFACDTFCGMPYDDAVKTGKEHKFGEFNYGLNFKLIQEQRKDLPISRVEGLVEDTLPSNLGQGKFCFVFLDMDLYQPTKFACEFFQDKIAVGGIIGFHDYGWDRCDGVKKAIEESLDMERFKKVFLEDYTIFFHRTQ
jgi:hypothetical protein